MVVKDVVRLNVSTIESQGFFYVLIEVDGKEWKRLGPWKDCDVANMCAKEALTRAKNLADKYWV